MNFYFGLENLLSFFLSFFFLIWLHHEACEVLVPQPGVEPWALAVKVLNPNHWTSREIP